MKIAHVIKTRTYFRAHHKPLKPLQIILNLCLNARTHHLCFLSFWEIVWHAWTNEWQPSTSWVGLDSCDDDDSCAVNLFVFVRNTHIHTHIHTHAPTPTHTHTQVYANQPTAKIQTNNFRQPSPMGRNCATWDA